MSNKSVFGEDGSVRTVQPEPVSHVDLVGADGVTRRIDLLNSKKFTLASRLGAIAGFAALGIVGPMGTYFLTDWNNFRKETGDTLQDIRTYMAGAQERGRSLMAITQRHENDIQELRQIINTQGNRLTAVEVEVRRTPDRRTVP